MKTAFDILHAFGAASLNTSHGAFFTCTVSLHGQHVCTGMGTTKESAEDTAYHGTKITLFNA